MALLPTWQGLPGGAPGLLAPAIVLALWFWAVTGVTGLPGTAAAHSARRRRRNASCGLGACLVLALTAAYLPNALSCLMAAVFFCTYAAYEPNRTGFWFHRRLRGIGCGLAAAVAVATQTLLGDAGAAAAVIAASAIYHRHERGQAALLRVTLADIAALRMKVMTMQVEATLAAQYPRHPQPAELGQGHAVVYGPDMPAAGGAPNADNKGDNRVKAG